MSSKQTGSFDFATMQNAAKNATGYITDISNGICVHEDDPNWSEATGDSVKITDSEVDVLQGGTPVASFGSSGAQIGQSDDTHLEMDYHSMQLIDNEGNTFFHVSDLRSNHIADDEYGEGFYAVVTETYTGDGAQTSFQLSNISFTVNYKIYVNGIEESNVTKNAAFFRFTVAPADGSIVTATYPTADQTVKAYTAGLRENGGDIGIMSFAEGIRTTASGRYAHAEGYHATARGSASHTEGIATTASGDYAHAEGVQATASGTNSHAEGSHTTASGSGSHAEGFYNTASGTNSHAEGSHTTASGSGSHAEGESTTASGMDSHVQNFRTIAGYNYQTAIGKYNNNKSGDLFEIGNGTADSARSNAFEVSNIGDINIPSGAAYKINSKSIFDLIYPVGSIYMSVNSTDPGTLFGGSWTPIQNRFLFSAGSFHTAGTEGGSRYIQAHKHSFTGASHNHGAGTNQAFLRYNQGTVDLGVQERSVASGASGNYKAPVVNSANVDWSYIANTGSETAGGTVGDVTGATTGLSGSTAEGNMPPYLTVYMWKRTA